MRKELLLDSAGDFDFVLQPIALALRFDQLGDGAGHFIERFAERSELVAIEHAHSMAEIAATDVERGIVQITNGTGDRARQDRASGQRANLEHHENQSRGEPTTAIRYGPSAPMDMEQPLIHHNRTHARRRRTGSRGVS